MSLTYPVCPALMFAGAGETRGTTVPTQLHRHISEPSRSYSWASPQLPEAPILTPLGSNTLGF